MSFQLNIPLFTKNINGGPIEFRVKRYTICSKGGERNLKKCKSCQSEIDPKATKCPHCQADQRGWFRRHPILTGILGIIAIIVVVSAAGGGNKSSSTGNQAGQNTQGSQGTIQPTPTPDPNPHFGDGTFVVGKDIQPGTYRTRVASSSCYYERLSGFGGGLGEIIANDNTSFPAVITIAATDKGFKSSGCGTWTQNLSQITDSKTAFGDGVFIVGTDIQPGTYKSVGQSSCYYARLSNFSGSGTSGIISNDNTDTAAIVTIAATDKGFKSNNCGGWTLQQ